MTTDIRPPNPHELPILVVQSRLVEGGDARDVAWFQAHQHLVLTEDGVIVGHTSWSVHDGYTTWDETVIEPPYQKRGYGRRLMRARAKRTPGLVFGACKPDNEPMVHLLTELGFHPCQTISGRFNDGPAVIWSQDHRF